MQMRIKRQFTAPMIATHMQQLHGSDYYLSLPVCATAATNADANQNTVYSPHDRNAQAAAAWQLLLCITSGVCNRPCSPLFERLAGFEEE
jgi:hypothetical protein